jgi:signal transduction histidine kinase
MRREVARAAALVVLAVPLAVSVYLLVLGDERGELERAALRAAVQVDSSYLGGDSAELPRPESGSQLGLYDPGGLLRAGTGPTRADAVTRQALTGGVSQGRDGGLLVVAVPAPGGEKVAGVVRAASSTAIIWRRTAIAWAVLAGVMATALLAALGVARRRARRLAAPLETLAAASRAIGEGDFTTLVPPCGITEIDRVAATQNTTAGRLGELLDRERQFAANASHQLRTPLTGLQLGLERALQDPAMDGRAALREALATTERLQATVVDVLDLHGRAVTDGRTEHVHRSSLRTVLDEAAARWHGRFAEQGRRLDVGIDTEAEDRHLPAVRTGQILDIMLDNALRHGSGRTGITGRLAGAATAIDITDEGRGVPLARGDVFRRGSGEHHGIGLALARKFALSLGGRLVLTARTPPIFTLMLPTQTDPPRDRRPAI